MKLNNKKIKYIIKQKEKGESSKKLAIIYGVTVRYINKIYFNYLEYGKDELYRTGRKKKDIDTNTEELVNFRSHHSGLVAEMAVTMSIHLHSFLHILQISIL